MSSWLIHLLLVLLCFKFNVHENIRVFLIQMYRDLRTRRIFERLKQSTLSLTVSLVPFSVLGRPPRLRFPVVLRYLRRFIKNLFCYGGRDAVPAKLYACKAKYLYVTADILVKFNDREVSFPFLSIKQRMMEVVYPHINQLPQCWWFCVFLNASCVNRLTSSCGPK